MKKFLMVLMMVFGFAAAAFAKDFTVTNYFFNPVTRTMESVECTISVDYLGKFEVNDLTDFEYVDAEHIDEEETSMMTELVTEGIVKDGKTVYSFMASSEGRTVMYDYVFFSNGDEAVREVEMIR